MKRELRCSFCGGKKTSPMVVPVHPDVYPDVDGVNGVRSEIFEYIKTSKPLAEALNTLSDETEHLPGGSETLWRLESIRTLTDLENRGVLPDGLSQSATTRREKSLMDKIDSLRRSRIGSLPVMVSARCHFCRNKFLTCLVCFPLTDQAVRRCDICGIARIACVSCHASKESVCRECRESLKTIEKTAGCWILSEDGHNRYWTYRAPCPEYLSEFILVHYTIDTKTCPYIFIYSENVGIDHWHGGRTRLGHDHHISYQLVYFDPKGNGDLIYAEVAEGVPHYSPLIFYACTQYGFPGPAIKDISKLPDKNVLRLFSAYTNEITTIPNDKEILERTGVSSETLFFCYEQQDTPQEIPLKPDEVDMDEAFAKLIGQETPQKIPYAQNRAKLDFLDKLLKKVAGFDPYAGFKGK